MAPISNNQSLIKGIPLHRQLGNVRHGMLISNSNKEKKMKAIILTFFLTIPFLNVANAACGGVLVSNGNGGTFCYETLPPIEVKLELMMTAPGGPTLPGQGSGIIDQIEHGLKVVGENSLPVRVIKQLRSDLIETYAQVMAFKVKEKANKTKCQSRSRDVDSGWWGHCNGIVARRKHIDKATPLLAKAIFELGNKKPNLKLVKQFLLKTKQSITVYKKVFFATDHNTTRSNRHT